MSRSNPVNLVSTSVNKRNKLVDGKVNKPTANLIPSNLILDHLASLTSAGHRPIALSRKKHPTQQGIFYEVRSIPKGCWRDFKTTTVDASALPPSSPPSPASHTSQQELPALL